MTVLWSPTALDGLKPLRSCSARENPTAAAKVSKAVLEAVERLRRFPSKGGPGRIPHTRELGLAGTPIIIPNRVRGDRIETVAVLHARPAAAAGAAT
ncbi:MAG: type II toxin-antitoxin system RelE/ParE family toxin [Kiloniellaceae bacterium]